MTRTLNSIWLDTSPFVWKNLVSLSAYMYKAHVAKTLTDDRTAGLHIRTRMYHASLYVAIYQSLNHELVQLSDTGFRRFGARRGLVEGCAGQSQVPILIPYEPAGLVGVKALYGLCTGSELIRTTDPRVIWSPIGIRTDPNRARKGTVRIPESTRTSSCYSGAKIARLTENG